MELVRGHITSLRGMHGQKVVHMDIEEKHLGFALLPDGTKEAEIIDLSSALITGNNKGFNCDIVSGVLLSCSNIFAIHVLLDDHAKIRCSQCIPIL